MLINNSMEFILSIIEKELEQKNFFLIRKYYLRSFWKFLQIYNLSIAILESYEGIEFNYKEINLRNYFYKDLLLNGIDSQKFRKMVNYMQKDFDLINKTITLLNGIKDTQTNYEGSYYRKGVIGVDMDEFPLDY